MTPTQTNKQEEIQKNILIISHHQEDSKHINILPHKKTNKAAFF